MKRMLICCVFVLGLSAIAFCGQVSKVQLTDGSVIEAEITSFENNLYTLNSSSLGIIKVDASKIYKIEMDNQASIPAPTVNLPGQLDANLIKSQSEQLKQKIMANPETMKIATELAADPEFQELIKDQSIVNAAKSQDIKALMSNEKFMNLINNPKIQEIGNKLKQENQ